MCFEGWRMSSFFLILRKSKLRFKITPHHCKSGLKSLFLSPVALYVCAIHGIPSVIWAWGIMRFWVKDLSFFFKQETISFADKEIQPTFCVIWLLLDWLWVNCLLQLSFKIVPKQWSGRFLGIVIGWDPSVCKSNQLHVDNLQFFSFNKFWYIL